MKILENSRAYAHPPFSNEEVFRAFAVFMPDVLVEAARSEFPGPDDGPFMGHVTTAILLILCTFSDEMAARVIAYSPDLEPQVRQVLDDPEGFLQSLRDEAPGNGPPDDEPQEQR
jgi:hypothetical protein